MYITVFLESFYKCAYQFPYGTGFYRYVTCYISGICRNPAANAGSLTGCKTCNVLQLCMFAAEWPHFDSLQHVAYLLSSNIFSFGILPLNGSRGLGLRATRPLSVYQY